MWLVTEINTLLDNVSLLKRVQMLNIHPYPLCICSIISLYIVHMSSMYCVMLEHMGMGSNINELREIGVSDFGCYVNLER